MKGMARSWFLGTACAPHSPAREDFAPVGNIRWYDDESSRTDIVHLITDVKAQRSGHDIGDLLMRMAVRARLVAGHQAMQRHGRGVPRERLLLHALADLLPLDLAPVDLVNVHGRLLTIWRRRARRSVSRRGREAGQQGFERSAVSLSGWLLTSARTIAKTKGNDAALYCR